MRLWLDDERDPKDPTIQSEFGATGDEIWLKTAEDTISYIMTHRDKIKSISLDHDLGSGRGSGYIVSDWIERQAYCNMIGRISWSVHSMNVVGAKRMIQSLQNADRYWNEHELNDQN